MFFSVGPRYRYDLPYRAVMLWKSIVDLLQLQRNRNRTKLNCSRRVIGLAAHWLARISFRRLIKRHYPLPTDVDNNDTTATIIEKLADVISSDYGRVSKRIYPLGAHQLIFIILL